MELTKKIIPNFLSGGGEMGKLIRAMDWSNSPLGNPAQWPQILRTSVSICLNARFPLLIWWGNDLVTIYNDAYRDLIAAKHPEAMGAKGAEMWPEIWHIIGPMLKGVLQTGEATWSEDQLLAITRNGYPEKCYFTFSYSAIRDETGNIGGVFCAVNETTKKVLTERHLSKQMSNLFMQAPVAICILRGENYVIEVINERMVEMWDRKMEEVLHKPAFDVLVELRDQGYKELLDNVYHKGERFVAEELPINLKRNGKIENAFVKFVYEPLREEDGTITGVMALAHEITGQVMARRKIEESEAFNRTVLESSPDCMKILDAEGRLLYMNSNGLCIMEIDDFSLFKNEHWWNMWGDENRQMVKDAVTKALTGETAYFQALGHTVKGTPKWWDVIVSPVLENRDTKIISHIISVSRDITEQKQAVIKLEESEAYFRQMADFMPEKVTNADADGNIIYYNQSWMDFTGASFEELKNEGWEKWIHPDELEEAGKRWQQSISTGNEFKMELQMLNHKGEYKWHMSHAKAVKEDNGKVKLWIGLNTDIQHQKEQKEELEKAVVIRTYQLQQANEELQQKNQEIALSKYNKRFLTEFSEKFSTYKPHSGFFDSLVQFIADNTGMDYVFAGKLEQNDKDEFAIQTIALSAFGKLTENINYPLPDGPCEQVIRGRLYSFPAQCRQKFPNNKTIEQYKVEGYVAYPLNDEQGNAVGLIAVMHGKEIEDAETVSSVLKIVARRAETELLRINHEEQLVQHNKTLEEKNEELVKMNKELQAFTYVSSHDLQEPLRKIKIFATIIHEKENQNLSDKGKDYLNRMRNAAMSMQTLIEDLLAYSHINVNERKFENTDLNKIVEGVKTELTEAIQEKNAAIEATQLGEANINPFQFRQLMHNLIGNALKFSKPELPPHIIIKSKILKGGKFQNSRMNDNAGQEKPSPEKNYCHISIADNGIGFDPQYKERIFEVFQRLHGKEEYAGTGIGLAIVKKIVENHNGIITANSGLGKGTTFDIYIPA